MHNAGGRRFGSESSLGDAGVYTEFCTLKSQFTSREGSIPMQLKGGYAVSGEIPPIVDSADVEPIFVGEGYARKRLLFATDEVTVALVEAPPDFQFKLKSHPEDEVVYVLEGSVHYADGRVVNPGAATRNWPNYVHGGHSGPKGVRAIEVKFPPDPVLLRMAGILPD